jgi:hypothetical protein
VGRWTLAQSELTSGGLAGDTTGRENHGTLVNTPVYATSRTSVANGAMDFESSSTQYVSCGDSVSALTFGTGAHSYSTWVKPEAFVDNAYQYIVATGNNVEGAQSGFGFYDQASELKFFQSAYTTPMIYSDLIASSVSAGTWYHVAMTHDGTNTQFYLNGQPVGSPQAITINTTTGKCRIGASTGVTSPFDGVIEDARMYNRALTAREVSQLYSGYSITRNRTLTDGLSARWTLADRDAVTTGSDLLSGWNLTSGWTAAEGSVINNANTFTDDDLGGIYKNLTTVGKRYRLTLNATSTGTSFKVMTGGSTDIVTYRSSFNGSVDFTAVSASLWFYVNTGGSMTITSMSLYELQETDVSGNGRHGTSTNGASAAADHDSVAASALNFDGALASGDDVISAGADFIGTGTDSVSVWIYPESLGEGGFGYIFTNGMSNLKVYTGNQVRLSSDGSTEANSASSAFSLDQWAHVVATRTADGTANIYINGVLSGSANQASGTPAAGSTVLIGNNAASTRTFDGRIADVRVWNRVLSPWEIWKLYND